MNLREGITATQYAKMAENGEIPAEEAALMENNPLLKFQHDSTLNEVYDKLNNNSRSIRNPLDKLATDIKRFRLGFSAYHLSSLTKSALFAGISPKDIENILTMKKPEFNRMILDELHDVRLRAGKAGINLPIYLNKPLTYEEGNEGKIAKAIFGTKYYKFVNSFIWNKAYAAYKITAAKGIMDDLDKGLINKATAEYRLNMVNSFFGGLPELAAAMPPVEKTVLRNVLFAPDWGLSLIKQMGYAASGKDLMATRYYTNMLAVNLFIRQAVQIFTGQHNTLAQDIINPTFNDKYKTTTTIAGQPVNIDVLGYEKEYPQLLFKVLQAAHEEGLLNGGTALLKGLLSKSGVLFQIAENAQKTALNKETPLSLLSTFMPFGVSTFMQKPSAAGLASGLLSSNTGFYWTPVSGASGLTNMILGGNTVNPNDYKRTMQFFDNQISAKGGYKDISKDKQGAIARSVLYYIDPDYVERMARIKYFHLGNGTQVRRQFERKYKTALASSSVNNIPSYYNWDNINQVLNSMIKSRYDQKLKGQ